MHGCGSKDGKAEDGKLAPAVEEKEKMTQPNGDSGQAARAAAVESAPRPPEDFPPLPPPPRDVDPPPPPDEELPFAPGRLKMSMSASVAGSSSSSSEIVAAAPAPRFAHSPVFVDAEAMKAKVRKNLTKPQYDVANFYHPTGVWRNIATSSRFEKLTLFVIALNAAWIGVDTDHNHAQMLLMAQPVFQVAEHFFCLFFTFEWFVRFMAFKRKRDGMRDGWFVFDSALVFMMIGETWVMTIILLALGTNRSNNGSGNGGLGNTSILRIARLARLSRMARMARLLRAMPELMILIKGIVAATRSVTFTLCLLCLLLYVFAIAFTQLTEETETVGPKYFGHVSHSMYTLLVYGTFMDNLGLLLNEMGKETLLCSALMLFFVLLSALTVMNMLIGVLCEVVSAVAATEKEGLQVAFVTHKLQEVLALIDKNGDGMISNDEFMKILEHADAIDALQEVGVDVVGLVDFADMIFMEEKDGEEEAQAKELTLQEFMTVVLQLRGSNNATVKDMVDLRKFVHTTLKQTNHQLAEIRDHMRERHRGSVKNRNGSSVLRQHHKTSARHQQQLQQPSTRGHSLHDFSLTPKRAPSKLIVDERTMGPVRQRRRSQ